MKIIIKMQNGEEKVMDGVPKTKTGGDIKQELFLSGHSLHYKSKSMKKETTLEELGVKDGDTICAYDTRIPKGYEDRSHYAASLRVQAGKGTRHKLLHKETQEVVKKGFADLGQKVDDQGKKVDKIEDILQGKATERMDGQTDKERMKQIRTVKRTMDNELMDLKENEDARKFAEKRARSETISNVAEIAEGSVSLIADGVEGETYEEKKASAVAQHKALLKCLKEKEKNKKAKEPNVPKAKKARAKKATKKVSVEPAVDTEPEPPAETTVDIVEEAAEAKAAETAVGTVEEAAEAKPAETPGNEEEELDEDARWQKMVHACTQATEGECNCRKCIPPEELGSKFWVQNIGARVLPEILSPFLGDGNIAESTGRMQITEVLPLGAGSLAESTGMQITEVLPLSDESLAESIGIQITDLPELLGPNLGA